MKYGEIVSSTFLGRILPILKGEAESIYKIVKEQNLDGNILEIGTGLGISTIVIGLGTKERNKNEKVYSIDKFNLFPSQKVYVISSLRKYGLLETVSLIEGDSKLLFEKEELLRERFRLVFVDGDHSYEAVKKDILNALPLLKDKGVLLAHDYCPEYPEVIRAIDDLIKDRIIRKEEVIELTFRGSKVG